MTIGKALTFLCGRWRAASAVTSGLTSLVAAGSLALLLLVLQLSGSTTFVEARVTSPLLFRARAWLGKEPELASSLKIYSFDDGSVARLQRPDLTIEDWAMALQAIDARRPRAILIDKIFAVLFDPTDRKAEWLQRLAAIRTPIYVGAFAVDREQRWRARLDLDAPLYDLAAARTDAGPLPPHRRRSGWIVYGPHPELGAVFDGSGHLMYDETGYVEAFLDLGQRFVPALALLTAQQRAFAGGRLLVDGRAIPLDDQGKIPINFVNVERMQAANRRLGTVVARARDDKPAANFVKSGDTVLILPEMYTGSTDFHSTPLGYVPGGFVQASLVNSVLSGVWLRPLSHAWLHTLLWCGLGVLWGSWRRSLAFWGVIAGATLGLGCVAVYLFAWHGVIVPLALPTLGFWSCALIRFADKTRQREEAARQAQSELDDAAEVAKAFRPDDLPQWPDLRVSAYHRPLSAASGDWYAFASSRAGRYRHFLIADITGHGVQAALIVSIAKTVLAATMRDFPQSLESPDFGSAYLQRLNAMLYFHGRGRHLLTALALTFDRHAAAVHYTSCGHPSPILYSPTAASRLQVAFLTSRSTLLGLQETLELSPQSRLLRPGDELVCYTDGMPVGHSVRHLQAFFRQRSLPDADAPRTLFEHLWRLETQRNGRRFDDDASVVWFACA